MPELNTSSKIGIGAVAVAVMLGVFLWLQPRNAEPGRLLAVPSPERTQLRGTATTPSRLGTPVAGAPGLVQLEDGSFGAGLTTADHEKLKNGQTVEIKVGGGSVTFSKTPPEKKP